MSDPAFSSERPKTGGLQLKAFQYAEIESYYRENGKLVMRAFKCTINGDQRISPATDSDETEPKTRVHLIAMQAAYKENFPQGLATIGHRLIEHCLPFFLDQSARR